MNEIQILGRINNSKPIEVNNIYEAFDFNSSGSEHWF